MEQDGQQGKESSRGAETSGEEMVEEEEQLEEGLTGRDKEEEEEAAKNQQAFAVSRVHLYVRVVWPH